MEEELLLPSGSSTWVRGSFVFSFGIDVSYHWSVFAAIPPPPPPKKTHVQPQILGNKLGQKAQNRTSPGNELSVDESTSFISLDKVLDKLGPQKKTLAGRLISELLGFKESSS